MDSLLKQVLEVQSETYNCKEMNKFIRKMVASIPGCKVREHNGNIYITKGVAKNYNCIVAHTDTVHDIIPQEDYKVVEVDGRVFAYDMEIGELTGVGGDDKCGIAIALTALRDLPVLKVAFFRDEEVGGLGSKDAEMKWFDNCNFVLQCDRRGNSGIVNEIYGEIMFDAEFSQAIAPIVTTYGYKEVSGMFTDVYQLVCNGLPVACANIECGYYNPHQPNEYIVLEDYERCKAMTIEMLSTINNRYEVDRTKPAYLQYDAVYDAVYNQYTDHCWNCNDFAPLDETEMLCHKCMGEYLGASYQKDKQPELYKPFKFADVFNDLKYY